MKQKVMFFLLLMFIISYGFCDTEKKSIEKVVTEYQKSINTYDIKKLKSLFIEPDSYDVQIFVIYLEGLHEQGLNIKYTIDVIELHVYDKIAEVRLKTVAKMLADDDSFDLMTLFGPSLVDSIMTLKKVNGFWKIVGEKIIE